MPRAAREKSATGIFYVLLTGPEAPPLFREDEDREKFLSTLRECRERSGFEIYAYCLLDDRVLLLIKEGAEPLSTVFKRLGGRFVYWYNLKYRRSGPLFRGRFRSEPVEDESSFLGVLHYILRRPARLGLETRPGEYRWSSTGSYAGWPDGVTETSFANTLVGSRAELMRYLTEDGNVPALDAAPLRRTGITDEAAMRLLEELTGCRSEAEFQSLPRSVREAYLRALYRRQVSLRQLARIAGISKTTVYRLVTEQ